MTQPRHARTRTHIRATLHALHDGGTRKLWLGGLLLAALTVLMGMALLGLSGWFITATAIAGLVPGAALVFDVFMPSAGIRLLALGRTGARYAERLVTHDATLASLARLRVRLFRAWSGPGAARTLMQRPARLLQRLTSDVDALDNFYLRLLVPACAALGAAMLVMLAFGLMRWWVGVLAGLWLVCAGWGIAIWHGLASAQSAAQSALAVERLRAQTVDLVAGRTELLMAQRLAAQGAAVYASDARSARADVRLYRAESKAALAYGVAGAVTLSAALLAVAWLAEGQQISAAVAAFGVLLALSAMEPFAALRRGAAQAGRTWVAARRLGEVLERAVPEATPAAGHSDMDDAAGVAIKLRNAGVCRDGVMALGDVNLEIRQGERVALIGTSGAGKSTLLSLMAGELAARHGEVHAVRASWMTQRTELFQDSVRDNLRIAKPDASDEQLRTVFTDAGLAPDVLALPQGLDTPLGEGGLGLSGGQSRRLALARLMLTDAPCWLLDEVTEGLDAETANDVLDCLARVAQGRTLVLATHWRREAALADRIVTLAGGRITGQARSGTPQFDSALRQLRDDRSGSAEQ